MMETAIQPANSAGWLMPVARWLRRRRWAANVAMAQQIRERLTFRERLIFDAELRPRLSDGSRIAYPDAFYHVSIVDVMRAATVAEIMPHG